MTKEERFEKIYSQGALTTTEIWVDKETGVNYLYHACGYSGGLTPLLDRDGKPVISQVINRWPYARNSISEFVSNLKNGKLELINENKHMQNIKNEGNYSAAIIPWGVLTRICENPETYKQKCYHRRWF